MAEDDTPHTLLNATQLSLPISLLRTRELVMDRFRPMLAELGVTEQQWRVLRVLAENGAADASTIADRASLMLPSLTRIMRTLSDMGLATSRQDPKDGRRILLDITPAGRSFLEQSAAQSAAIHAEIEATIGSDKLQALLELLVDIRTRLNGR